MNYQDDISVQEGIKIQGDIKAVVRQWVAAFVVDLNLCPFARRELNNGSVRFVVTDVDSEEALRLTLQAEFELLSVQSDIETTLLILPNVLQNFFDFNQFLKEVNIFLKRLKLKGIFQIASFHPDYQFAGTDANDPENYTNRAPYPILHILREASLDKAVEAYAEVDDIPRRNVALMNNLGTEKLQKMMEALLNK